jgi:hypothetical protein
MIVDQLSDPVVRHQEIAPPEKAEQRPPGDRKDIVALQAAPDRCQVQDAFQCRIAGVIGPVQRTDAGADHHIGGDAVLGQRLHHADLNRAKTAAAGQHEGCPRRSG